MLTPAQQKWVDHLSDTNKVEIFPFDPTAESKFQQIKEEVQKILGPDIAVLHRGASGLGISGQREIDIYMPVAVNDMESFVYKIEGVWGKPKSIYPEERIKWIRNIDGTYIEVMITNKNCKSWIDGEKFNDYLKQNSQALDEYRKLKEDATGVTTREYYRRKIEFINEILNKITEQEITMLEKFDPYIKNQIFLEVLDLVKQNSKGKIWLIGGYLYKNLSVALYGGEPYYFDIDFIVEERNDTLKEVAGWKIETNRYGSDNYVREGNKMSFTDLRKAIRVSGLKNPTIEEFIAETPLTVQSIAYDLGENKLIGQKGITALLNKTVEINNKEQAEFYAQRKGKSLQEIIDEKTRELNFKTQ